MSKILITGGAGFIGGHVSKRLLKAGHSVRILDVLSAQVHGTIPRDLEWLHGEGIQFLRGSVTNRDDMRRALEGIEVVVHLAAETGTGQSMYEVARYCETNVSGTAVLLDILANDPGRTVRRMVLASSRSIYGEGAFSCRQCQPSARVYPEARTVKQLSEGHWEHACQVCGSPLEPLPTHEDDPAKPASIYAATKYTQEDLVRVAAASLGIDYAILRLQNVYGEGQSLKNPYTGILSIFSTRIRRGLPLPIFEDGQETRDFVHVHDVAESFGAAVESVADIRTALNVGTGVKTTVEEIARHLSDAFAADANLIVTGEYRVGDIRHNFADTQRLQQVLGYSPSVDLAAGMRRFAEWVNRQALPEDRLDSANAELRSLGLMGG